MDDCDLEKLSAAPAKLSPKFNRNTTEYESTVPSSVEKVKVDCLTSDSGASYQVFGAGGEKSIPLKEGEVNEIRIEVSAEDGTVKNYIIRVKRLSASDASLSQLSLSCGKLDPVFSMDWDEYSCTVPCTTEQVTINPIPPDKKCAITIEGSQPDFVVPLLLGQTDIVVRVSSVDGTKTKDYTIKVYRKQLPWPVTIKDANIAMKFECPMTLSPMYNPISVAGSNPKVSMSEPCIDMLTRRSKVNPLTDEILDKDWRVIDIDLDKQLSKCVAASVYSYKGAKEEVPFQNMAIHINKCEVKPSSEVDPKKITETSWYKAEFESTAKSDDKPLQHKVEVRNWEKRLQHMASESNADALMKMVEKTLKSYREKLPKKPGQNVRFSDGESPVDDLQQINICAAAAIKAKSKEGKYHLKLALALEEQHHLAELYGFSKKDEDASDMGAGTNIEAKESSKLEECQAISRLRGVAANAPLALHLKAIDEEYKSLLDSGQSSRADHVQALYAWRSKQALKGEQSKLQKLDESDPLTQAYLKYMDAVVLDSNNYQCNLHLSRMLIERGDYDEAIKRLHQAAGLKPTNVASRFLLGLALCLRKGGTGDRTSEALSLMHEGLDHILMARQAEAEAEGIAPSSSTDLHAEDIFRCSNVQVLRGLMVLAENLDKAPQDGMRSAKEIYHCICLHASMALCAMFHRGNTFQQIEWILLDAHYKLLEVMMRQSPPNTAWIAQRCRYLSAMIRSATIPRNEKILALQEKVSQKLVSVNPCNSESLYLLGLSQLMIFDNEINPSNTKPLLDARLSLEASIELEGKPASGEPPPQITGQQWWQDKVAAEKAKTQQQQQQTSVSNKAQPAARGRGTPAPQARAGRGARGAPQPQRGGRGPAKVPSTTGRGRGATTSRGAKGGVATPTASSSDTKCNKAAEPAKPSQTTAPAPVQTNTKPGPINRASYLSRLALARALSRTDDGKEDARGRYEEVIKMAPEVHDSYIELAELLVSSDPLAAVDIYCRFPSKSNEEDSFDDAYLSGEIVSILMKHDKLDDERLVEHMVKWGRVMGIGVLEKYMGILDSKFKTDMLKRIYAGVHRKDIDDPDLAAFFKFKCWI